MDKLLVVAKREYMERVRSKWFIVMTLLVPVLISGLFIVPIYMASRTAPSSNARNVLILDATGTDLGRRVADALLADRSILGGDTAAPVPQVRVVSREELPAAEEEATLLVMQPRSIVGFLVLDDSTLAGSYARYAGRNASSMAEVDRLRIAARQSLMMVRLEREGVRAETVNELARMSLRMPTERITERGRGGSGQTGFFLGFGIGILLLMSILIHGQNVLRGVLEEKTTRVAEVVISSVKPDTLLAGKVFGVGAVGLTQQIAWLGISAYLIVSIAPALLGQRARGAATAASAAAAPAAMNLSLGDLTIGFFLAALGFFLLGFIFYAALYAAAGAMVNSEQEAQQSAMPVMILLMSTWLLVNPILINPTGTLATVLSWLPWSSPIIMPIRMALVPVPWHHVVGSMLVAAVGCAGVIWLSARIYRVGMLMYGKRPSLRELVRWVRYA